MENTLELKSNLVMPTHYVELDREEMCYVEGGISTNAVACIIDIGLFAICGFINAGLRFAGFFGKGAAKAYIKRNAPKWAKFLSNITGVVSKIQGLGGTAGLIGGALSDIGSFVDRITNLFSIGGIIASVLDICDGRWDGQISY